MPKGYVYILECNDGSYYTGSTIDIEKRIAEHNEGQGANHTKKRWPVSLVYLEEFQRIDDAFNREKQIQGWSRAKKEALIVGNFHKLPKLSMAYRDLNKGGFESLSHQKIESLSHQTQNLQNKKIYSVPEALEGTKKDNNKLVAERSRSYRSNGKLLLTGEYVVLDGAKALAIPTRFGQRLNVEENNTNSIIWKSYDENNNVWFEDELKLDKGKILKQNLRISSSIGNDNSTRNRLIQILEAAKALNPEFLKSDQGYTITTHLDFNRQWGLGTSSTLINNIANWTEVDAYKLLAKTFGGSGYDIACAQNNYPITYQLINSQKRVVKPALFNPSFKDHLYFVYLNQKQNSRDGIKAYKALGKVDFVILNKINTLTDAIITSKSLSEFEALITLHENSIGNLIQQTPVKSELFADFNGAIKSLGAWGGDFILVTSKTDPSGYFNAKGFETIIPYDEMVL